MQKAMKNAPFMATIFALASAPGRAGVAVVRISGGQAGAVLQLLTQRDMPSPRMASLRSLVRPHDKMVMDKAVVVWFPAPHSFTGEDVVELHLHGGRAVIQAVTSVLAQQKGVRLAQPGEFTRRGFENGKFDLTEAEAIADLVHAETEAQMQQALRQMDGALERLYDGWHVRLKASLAYIEASIDFADDELPADLAEKQAVVLQTLRDEIQLHLADHRRGERLRDGYKIAILGPPNAGKSSLLNHLAQRDAAIVSAIAGTTRDVVEVQLDLGGYPVVMADTAGLRAASDVIEQEGIRRAHAQAMTADLKLLVFDGEYWPALDNLTADLIDERTLCVVNKADLMNPEKDGFDSTTNTIPAVGGRPVCFISLRTGVGVDSLLSQLTERVADALHDRGQPVLTRLRHRTALESCQQGLDGALSGLRCGEEMALVAENVRLSMRDLGQITGRVDVEDLLDVIFRDFCIGK
jgi:tRNA modification GTPase